MTLFTAEGMIRAYQRFSDRGLCHVPSVIQRALLRWLYTQTGRADKKVTDPDWRGWLVGERTLHVQRAPGNTCLSALEQTLAEAEADAAAPTPTTDRGGSTRTSGPRSGRSSARAESRAGARPGSEARAGRAA